MDSARTAWAEGIEGLSEEQIEALTIVSEEAARRGLDVDLDPRDAWSSWPPALDDAGADDLADRVREIAAAHDEDGGAYGVRFTILDSGREVTHWYPTREERDRAVTDWRDEIGYKARCSRPVPVERTRA